MQLSNCSTRVTETDNNNISSAYKIIQQSLIKEHVLLIYSTLFVNNDSRTIIKREKTKNNINQSKQLTMNTDIKYTANK